MPWALFSKIQNRIITVPLKEKMIMIAAREAVSQLFFVKTPSPGFTTKLHDW
jgi:hypothetical protein